MMGAGLGQRTSRTASVAVLWRAEAVPETSCGVGRTEGEDDGYDDGLHGEE